jgi:hypothetical protein
MLWTSRRTIDGNGFLLRSMFQCFRRVLEVHEPTRHRRKGFLAAVDVSTLSPRLEALEEPTRHRRKRLLAVVDVSTISPRPETLGEPTRHRRKRLLAAVDVSTLSPRLDALDEHTRHQRKRLSAAVDVSTLSPRLDALEEPTRHRQKRFSRCARCYNFLAASRCSGRADAPSTEAVFCCGRCFNAFAASWKSTSRRAIDVSGFSLRSMFQRFRRVLELSMSRRAIDGEICRCARCYNFLPASRSSR